MKNIPTGEGKGWAKGKTKETDIRILRNIKSRINGSFQKTGGKPQNFTMKGKNHTLETKRKISVNIKRFWEDLEFRRKMLERSHSERKIKQAIVNLPSGERIRELWKTKEYREKVMKNSLKGLIKRPTSFEKFFIQLFEKYEMPFKYVGDGAFFIGEKNPDFISKDGSKICIEVSYGFFKDEDYEIRRIEYFAKHGWKCLVFFEDDLKNKDQILNQINFIHKGGE